MISMENKSLDVKTNWTDLEHVGETNDIYQRIGKLVASPEPNDSWLVSAGGNPQKEGEE